MKNYQKYNLFIFISTISRNIVEVFSSVLLFQMGYKLKYILTFYFLVYIVGILVNIVSLSLTKIIKPKYILVFSSIMFGITFYFLATMQNSFDNLIIYSILFSISSYTYHSLRHYFALRVLDNKKDDKKIAIILIFNYLAVMLSSYIGAYITNRLGLFTTLIITIVISFISIIPISLIKNRNYYTKISISKTLKKMNKKNTIFFFLEQFKVIFLSLQPLYLYLFIDSNLEYIGIFNILIGIASVVFVYVFATRINKQKYFWLLNILFSIILVLKINIYNKYIILVIAFLEGLGMKMYETVSLENIYNEGDNKDITSYLIICEFIFCLVRSVICLLFCLFLDDIKVMLYISILGILISGFIKYDKKYYLRK